MSFIKTPLKNDFQFKFEVILKLSFSTFISNTKIYVKPNNPRINFTQTLKSSAKAIGIIIKIKKNSESL